MTYRIWVNFDVVYKKSKFFLLQRDVLVQAPFVKKSILSSLNSLGIFVEYQLAIKLSFYSWSLTSNLLIHISLLMPVPHSLNCGNSVVSFEIEKCESSPFDFF